ncbi:MAG: alkaline phosphatase PhoX [Lacipirellulaceae bacterium]
MDTSRRQFLQTSAAYAAGFAGLRSLLLPGEAWGATAASTGAPGIGYGALVADPAGLLDLPKGFRYRVISRTGDLMDDGLLVSSAPDGMATFAGPAGEIIVVRNHESKPGEASPFGAAGADQLVRMEKLGRSRLYDDGEGINPGAGGTSTIVYDTKSQRVVRQFQSLAGTERNCAGGPTPWGSWITCEETVDKPGFIEDAADSFVLTKHHGYNFEVPATIDVRLADPTPLVAMGRFRHEAVAVDPRTGIVYETEDRDDGVIYRFLPNKPGAPSAGGDLRAGGRLQALAIVGRGKLDTRNWPTTVGGAGATVGVGERLAVRWIDLDHPESVDDDLRHRAVKLGAAKFARGEGMWHSGDAVFFACTSGGEKQIGQIWKYTPSPVEGQPGEAADAGTLELYLEPNDGTLLENADNLTVAPWGDLVLCEDRSGEVVRLVGVTPQGECYTLARNHERCEFSGVTFSPDGSTMFVNVQVAGLTLAITGPWRA